MPPSEASPEALPLAPEVLPFEPPTPVADLRNRHCSRFCHIYAPIGPHNTTEERRRQLWCIGVGICLGSLLLLVMADLHGLPMPPTLAKVPPQVPMPSSPPNSRPAPYRIQLPSAEVINNITFTSPLPRDPTCQKWIRTNTPAQICSHDTEAEAERKCRKYIDLFMPGERGDTIGLPASDVDDGWPADKEWVDGVAPVYVCASNNTRTALIGPFTTRVQEWHTIHVYLSMLSPGDRIIKYTGDTVRATDPSIPIGYPPLHMHHVHLYANHLPHWFETHGDYLLDAHGYSLSSPPVGSCVVVQEKAPTKVFAQVNDVRFSTSTAMATSVSRSATGGEQTEYERASLDALRSKGLPYRWYFRIQFVLEPERTNSSSSFAGPPPDASSVTAASASAPVAGAATAGAERPSAQSAVAATTEGCHPVRKIVLMYPVDEHASRDHLARFDCGSRQALFTYSIELPCSGTVVPPGWMHTHRARHGGYVLLRGEHTLFSLFAGASNVSSDVGNRTAAHAAYAAFVTSFAVTPASERVVRLRRAVLELAGRRLLCHDDEHVPTSVVLSENGDGLGGHFDRQGSIACAPFHFRAGEKVTAFSFVSPNWAKDLKVFPQHTMLFLLFTPDPTAREQPPPPLITQQAPKDFRVLDLDRSLVDARALHCKTPIPSWGLPDSSSAEHRRSALECTVEAPLPAGVQLHS